MNKSNKNLEIIHPQNQTKLFGFKNYFNFFISLHKKKKLPNSILLSGPKGSGKATFAYHFINYLLSFNEKNSYSVDNLFIDTSNKSYQNLCNNTHPNFSLLTNVNPDEDIKIENVRNTLKFLNKTTFSSGIKVVLIDSAEYLNINSSNALLKVLEENDKKTFFFIINNNSHKILSTIKSRCIEFNIFFNFYEKKRILINIINQYLNNFDVEKVNEVSYYDTPGNVLKYILILNDGKIDLLKDKLSCILNLSDKYKKKNDPQLLTFLSLLIELFYNELSFKNNKNLNQYFLNKFKLLKQIDYAKRFNLDKKSMILSLQETIKNEYQ